MRLNVLLVSLATVQCAPFVPTGADNFNIDQERPSTKIPAAAPTVDTPALSMKKNEFIEMDESPAGRIRKIVTDAGFVAISATPFNMFANSEEILPLAEYRLKLFEHITLKSIIHQKTVAPVVLLITDPELPDSLLKLSQDLIVGHPNLYMVPTNVKPGEHGPMPPDGELIEMILKSQGGNPRFASGDMELLNFLNQSFYDQTIKSYSVTRLDSDDGIPLDFFEGVYETALGPVKKEKQPVWGYAILQQTRWWTSATKGAHGKIKEMGIKYPGGAPTAGLTIIFNRDAVQYSEKYPRMFDCSHKQIFTEACENACSSCITKREDKTFYPVTLSSDHVDTSLDSEDEWLGSPTDEPSEWVKTDSTTAKLCGIANDDIKQLNSYTFAHALPITRAQLKLRQACLERRKNGKDAQAFNCGEKGNLEAVIEILESKIKDKS